jgi:hypothetical protein
MFIKFNIDYILKKGKVLFIIIYYHLLFSF